MFLSSNSSDACSRMMMMIFFTGELFLLHASSDARSRAYHFFCMSCGRHEKTNKTRKGKTLFSSQIREIILSRFTYTNKGDQWREKCEQLVKHSSLSSFTTSDVLSGPDSLIKRISKNRVPFFDQRLPSPPLLIKKTTSDNKHEEREVWEKSISLSTFNHVKWLSSKPVASPVKSCEFERRCT